MLYVTAVVLLAIFLGGFLIFTCYAAIEQIRVGVSAQMTEYSGLDCYTNYGLADTFMGYLWTLLPVIMILGVGYWVYIYSQHKSAGVGYE